MTFCSKEIITCSYNVILLFLSLDQEVMQDSKSNSVNGNPFMETGIQWLRVCLFFLLIFCFFKTNPHTK